MRKGLLILLLCASWTCAHAQKAEPDSSLLALHDIYANSPTITDLRQFYKEHDEPCLKELKKQDMQMLKKYDQYIKDYKKAPEFIKAAAPYYAAYALMLKNMSSYLRYGNWSKAYAFAKEYAPYFGDDHRYNDLLRILSAPADSTLIISKMDSAINTPRGDEYVPVISADGNTLLFCGCHRPDSIGKEDIYICHRTASGWGPSAPLAELSTDIRNEAPLSLSADGTKMILFVGGRLCTSTKGPEGWQKPEEKPARLNRSSWQADGMITSDGKAFLFAAKIQTAHELRQSINIFVSLLDENGEWGEPIDLGPTINTPMMDRSPVLHPDMKTLYFSSDGHSTIGSLDVFMSTRLREDSWTEWSEPVNIGTMINHAGSDCWYKISTDGTTAYFSNVEYGQHDIYTVRLPESVRPTPVATISGRLTDPKGQPVTTVLKWEDLETHEQVGQSQTDPTDGSFFIVLPEGKNYGYYIDDDSYFPISNNIDLREKSEAVQLEKQITVASFAQMAEEHIPMPLNNLFFATGKADLQPSSLNELARVVDILTKHPYRVEIGGHTDNVGSDTFNQQLSEQRARAVKNWLVAHGIAANRLSVRGYGKTRPVASNETEEGRRTNRRVEIKILGL